MQRRALGQADGIMHAEGISLSNNERKADMEYAVDLAKDHFSTIPHACGGFDIISETPEGLRIAGWILLPGMYFASIELHVNGKLALSSLPILRQDVATAWHGLRNSERSGFDFLLSKDIAGNAAFLTVIGKGENKPEARMDTMYRSDIDTSVPQPPAELMVRVAMMRDPHMFKMQGLRGYGEFMSAIRS